MSDPLAHTLAAQATRLEVLSARPDAPVVADRARRERTLGAGLGASRLRLAAGLHALARRVEPRRTGACHPA